MLAIAIAACGGNNGTAPAIDRFTLALYEPGSAAIADCEHKETMCTLVYPVGDCSEVCLDELPDGFVDDAECVIDDGNDQFAICTIGEAGHSDAGEAGDDDGESTPPGAAGDDDGESTPPGAAGSGTVGDDGVHTDGTIDVISSDHVQISDAELAGCEHAEKWCLPANPPAA